MRTLRYILLFIYENDISKLKLLNVNAETKIRIFVYIEKVILMTSYLRCLWRFSIVCPNFSFLYRRRLAVVNVPIAP